MKSCVLDGLLYLLQTIGDSMFLKKLGTAVSKVLSLYILLRNCF